MAQQQAAFAKALAWTPTWNVDSYVQIPSVLRLPGSKFWQRTHIAYFVIVQKFERPEGASD